MDTSPHLRETTPLALPARAEWPTVVLACVIYAGWLLVTGLQRHLPAWLLLAVGAWLTAWHMSLQHEVLHGHPTRWQRVNDLIGFTPLSLWLPYARYREQHMGHHRAAHLTDPLEDPESYYVTLEAWLGHSRLARAVLQANNSLAGRVLIGPLCGITKFLLTEARLLGEGDRNAWRIWLPHLLGAGVIVAWLHFFCHMSLIRYAALFVYPGFSLALIRSFAEHRAASIADHRTAIVERAPVLGLLFLHNNLHVVHHLEPGLPWYRIPQFYRAHRASLLRRNGGLVYHGYGDVARRFLFRVHDRPDHPLRRDPAFTQA